VLTAYERLRSAIEHVTWLLTGALVLLVSANVFARYVLKVGLLWAEELSRLAFVWVVFLGAYVALCRKGHMALEIGIQKLAPSAQRPVLILSRVLVLIFLAVVVWSGAQLVGTTLGYGRRLPMLGISAAWGYLSVPVAAALMFLEALRSMRSDVAAGTSSSPPLDAQS
jgi:TRAP-type C4-dicarboxylate transport system permease small subunit